MLLIRHCSTVTEKFIKKLKKKKFVDSLNIFVRGGIGGQGLPNFGGIGGRGGSVYLIGDEKTSLKKVETDNYIEGEKRRLLFKAENGTHSRKFMLKGAPGKDLYIPVPPGVTVANNKGRALGEVLEAKQTLLVAKGGEGGEPSNGFKHRRGHHAQLILDLKLIADIGLVGFPNAGKSSLLKSISSMNVAIKPFPFTTLHPQVGLMKFQDLRRITVADLPGLVEGAHANYGLGHAFLKHIERTKVLLFVVDLTGFQFQETPHRSPFETVIILLKEMELSRNELLSKPALLAFNKLDLPGAEEAFIEAKHKIINMKDYLHEIDEESRPKNEFHFEQIIGISARENAKMDELKQEMRISLDRQVEAEHEAELLEAEGGLNDYLRKSMTEHATESGSWV